MTPRSSRQCSSRWMTSSSVVPSSAATCANGRGTSGTSFWARFRRACRDLRFSVSEDCTDVSDRQLSRPATSLACLCEFLRRIALPPRRCRAVRRSGAVPRRLGTFRPIAKVQLARFENTRQSLHEDPSRADDAARDARARRGDASIGTRRRASRATNAGGAPKTF